MNACFLLTVFTAGTQEAVRTVAAVGAVLNIRTPDALAVVHTRIGRAHIDDQITLRAAVRQCTLACRFV